MRFILVFVPMPESMQDNPGIASSKTRFLFLYGFVVSLYIWLGVEETVGDGLVLLIC